MRDHPSISLLIVALLPLKLPTIWDRTRPDGVI
jgi:hypothetical protein